VAGCNWHLFDSTTIRTVVGHQGSFAATSPPALIHPLTTRLSIYGSSRRAIACTRLGFPQRARVWFIFQYRYEDCYHLALGVPASRTQPPNNAPILTTSDVNATKGSFTLAISPTAERACNWPRFLSQYFCSAGSWSRVYWNCCAPERVLCKSYSSRPTSGLQPFRKTAEFCLSTFSNKSRFFFPFSAQSYSMWSEIGGRGSPNL